MFPPLVTNNKIFFFDKGEKKERRKKYNLIKIEKNN